MLHRYRPLPVLGSLSVRVEAERPYEFKGVEHPRQCSALTLDFAADGSISCVLGGTMLFDDVMAQDTRAAWGEWGLRLHYENTEQRGKFAFEPLPGFAETMAANLAGIE